METRETFGINAAVSQQARLKLLAACVYLGISQIEAIEQALVATYDDFEFIPDEIPRVCSVPFERAVAELTKRAS